MYMNKPWLEYYDKVPHTINYPRNTMYEALMESTQKYPDRIAYDFLGYCSTYIQFAHDIDQCSKALASLGLKEGDRITIAMPTSPQGVICFYAANKLGAVASMIHPLSTVAEIEFYIKISKSRFALTLDAFYSNFKSAMVNAPLEKLILTKISDYMPRLKRIGFKLTMGRKIPTVPNDNTVIWFADLMKGKFPDVPQSGMKSDDMSVILYSGGTTGKPKGIMLSNYNFISHGLMVASWVDMKEDDSILAILPIFHGFGLGVCINGAFMGGGKSIMVPTFTSDNVARLIKKNRPSILIGVPTIYEALNKSKLFNKSDLSCLRAAFSGADSLPKVVKERFEEIVKRQNGSIKLLEGYGLTEAVTGIIATPLNEYRENSIGIPFPDMMAKIVKIDTMEDAQCGEEGELCIHGPAVMLGYLEQQEETSEVLKNHPDGLTWLHTGDICTMDKDGFFYFKLRQKRMIKSSGMNVYPVQVEAELYKHPDVAMACVIGIPDRDQVERVKAFVVLENPAKAGMEMEDRLIRHCQKTLIKWSCPREVEFRDNLPLTRVGKVAFKQLENEEIERLRKNGEFIGNK